MSPIVPRSSIAGRALVAVVAIMTFLASMTTGAVLLVSASAAEWQSDVSSEITVQVRPAQGRDLDHDTQGRGGGDARPGRDCRWSGLSPRRKSAKLAGAMARYGHFIR